MRELVYVPNKRHSALAPAGLDNLTPISPRFFGGLEPNVQRVVVTDLCPNAGEIVAAYEAAGIPVELVHVGADEFIAKQAPALVPDPEPRTRDQLLTAAKSLGLKVQARWKTETIRRRVRAAEAGS